MKLLTVLFLISPLVANAAYVDLNSFYYSDSFVQGSSAAATSMYIDFSVGFNLDRAGRFQAGWDYCMFDTASAAGSATQTYASTQMGPKFYVYFDKARNIGLGLAYNLVTQASYSQSGSTGVIWKGSGIKADLGYIWRADSGINVGVKINYASATYIDQFIGSAYTAISVSRTHIYPSVVLMYDF